MEIADMKIEFLLYQETLADVMAEKRCFYIPLSTRNSGM
jgi:hypothetical protein